MNEFKVGDQVWFFYTGYGRGCWSESTVIYPGQFDILSGQIIDIEEKRDNVFIYVEGEKELLSIGWAFFEDWMCKSKSEAIYLMIKRLEELRDE